MTEPSITQIKNLLRDYKQRMWGCIWRDALGIHFKEHYWDAVIVGDLRWVRFKVIR